MDLALVTCVEDWLMVRVSTQAGFAFVKGLSLCQVTNYKLDSVIYQFVVPLVRHSDQLCFVLMKDHSPWPVRP